MKSQDFEKAVILYKDKLFNYLFWMTGDRFEAEDLLQETFLRYFKYGDSVDNPKAWLFRVARNLFLKREKKRMRETSLELIEPAPVSPCIVYELEREELRKKVREELQKLRKHHKEILILRYMEGLSYEEIAEITGENLGTVKSRLNRAREKLREKLENFLGVKNESR